MCRMVGVVFRDRFPLGTLTDLRHVSEIGKIPGEKEPGHKDGWGIVSFRNGSPRYIGRSTRPAFIDPSFDSALEDMPELISPNILIAHVRAASAGGATLPNTHPFVVGGIVLAHNGTIKSFNPVTKLKPKGETDSERLLLVLTDRLEETGDLRSALKSLIRDDIRKHKSSAAILLVSDGKTLYGYRDYSDARKASYYDLRIAKCEDHVTLFQETYLGYNARTVRVKKGELVSVGLDLKVKREMLR
jgi:predicted glutamine amidotransferase